LVLLTPLSARLGGVRPPRRGVVIVKPSFLCTTGVLGGLDGVVGGMMAIKMVMLVARKSTWYSDERSKDDV
jgi:hypothetical protein